VSEKHSSHTRAILQALLVTFLWSTSFVLIKIGLQDIPALSFAGLRYSLAFLCLLPWVTRSRMHRAAIRALTRSDWLRLIGLGVLYYAVTQGAQFVGLSYLPSITVSLILNFTTIVVALMGLALLSERPTRLQWAGVAINLIGVVIYFYPVVLPEGQRIGLWVMLLGMLANAASAILGRHVNRGASIHPLIVTTISMGLGGALLLLMGGLSQGLPLLSAPHWLFVIWLAVVNTAFAFTLWNHTLRALSAMESSIINSTMLVQIAVLAWIFLGEAFTLKEAIGMGLAGLGTYVVQMRR
jgi:drug/metabolite transporter (DMT)-like permease